MSLLRDQVRRLQELLKFIEDSKIFQDPDSPSSFGSAHVSHQTCIPSSSRKLCRDSRMQRDTREDMSIPETLFYCQPARRAPEELHNDSMNLATLTVEEPLQSTPIPCFSVGAREKGPDDRNCLKSMSHHAAGSGTCTQSGMTISSYLPAKMHLKNVLQWIKEIEAATSLMDLINPKSITGEDFPDYEELNLMMAAELTRCYDKYPHFQKKIRVKEQIARKDKRFLRGSQIAYSIHEITERRAVTSNRAKNSYTKRKTEECLQRKTIGSCSRRDTCCVLHAHATGDRESMRKEVRDARRSRLEQASSSEPKVKEQTDVKSSNSLEASPATRAKIPCL